MKIPRGHAAVMAELYTNNITVEMGRWCTMLMPEPEDLPDDRILIFHVFGGLVVTFSYGR